MVAMIYHRYSHPETWGRGYQW